MKDDGMKIENSVEIEAPIDRVWEITLDVEDWPNHTPTMTSIKRIDPDGPLKVGSEVRIKQPGQRAKTWTVTALDLRSRFAWSARFMGTTMTANHYLKASGEGTTNTLRVDIEGRIAPLVGAMIARPIRKAIETENHGLKAAAETKS